MKVSVMSSANEGKEPVEKIDPIFGDITIVCPGCGNPGIISFNGNGFNFCPDCGQKLNWENWENGAKKKEAMKGFRTNCPRHKL